jgi:hypothetical protein
MFANSMPDHLTADPRDARAHRTHPGQASWAEPETSRACGECVFWNGAGAKVGASSLKPRRCEKYTWLTDSGGARVPSYAIACRFFLEPGANIGPL